jgi:hypothetical protein
MYPGDMIKPLLAPAFALLLTAACGTPWTVVRQASPDPFAGKPDLIVEPLHFDSTQVGEKSEKEYAAGKQPDEQASWQADKQGMSERFEAGLMSEGEGTLHVGGPGGATVRPIVTFIEPGFYAYVASHPSEVDISVMVLDAAGNVADEITAKVVVGASMTDPASGTRLRQAAERLGKIVAQYLKTRVVPGG